MILYEFQYNDYRNKIIVTAIKMEETAKSYRPVDGKGLATYKQKLPKDDVGKLIGLFSNVCYYSADNDVIPFLSELDKKYERKINALAEEIQKVQEQKDRVKSATVVTGE